MHMQYAKPCYRFWRHLPILFHKILFKDYNTSELKAQRVSLSISKDIPISGSRNGNSLSFVTRRDATLLLVRKAYITCLWVFYFSSFAGN